jgi:hypothetical protein
MKCLVTEAHALDFRQLMRDGWLRENTTFNWVWRDPRGQELASVTVTALTDRVILSYILPHRSDLKVHEDVPLFVTIGPWGATRRWVGCPACRRRAAILYLHQERFRCRRCAQLAYPSQYPSQGRSYGVRHLCLTRFQIARYSSQAEKGLFKQPTSPRRQQ